jgi:hypothetical protein
MHNKFPIASPNNDSPFNHVCKTSAYIAVGLCTHISNVYIWNWFSDCLLSFHVMKPLCNSQEQRNFKLKLTFIIQDISQNIIRLEV